MTARGPAWLKLSDDRTGWSVIHDRASVVRRIYLEASLGKGEQAIAVGLNRDEIATWGDNGRAPATMWRKSYITKILSSWSVIGTLIPNVMEYDAGRLRKVPTQPIPGYYPAVIEIELWSAARDIKETANPARGRHSASPVQNILGGLAFCSSCGSSMTRVVKGKGQSPKLVCTAAKNGKGCAYQPVALSDIELAVKNAFFNTQEKFKGDPYTRLDFHEISELERRMSIIDRSLDKSILSGEILSDSAVKNALIRLVEEKKALQVRVKKYKARMERLRSFASRLDALSASLQFREFDRSQVNASIRKLFTMVIVDVTEMQMEFIVSDGVDITVSFERESVGAILSKKASQQRRASDGRFVVNS